MNFLMQVLEPQGPRLLFLNMLLSEKMKKKMFIIGIAKYISYQIFVWLFF